jgi:hypothetical protein
MKNYFIVFLVACVAVSISFIYKQGNQKPLHHFPITEFPKMVNIENPLYLVLFFSIQNYKDCLGGIDILNSLKSPYIVYGLVPPDEQKNENHLRGVTGAKFKIFSGEKFKRFAPIYAPTLFGVSQKGRILFVLPGIPNQKEYLQNFLTTIYNKAYPVLLL